VCEPAQGKVEESGNGVFVEAIMFATIGRLITASCFYQPIFVVGTGRSGTSIMLQALGEHSRILSADRESPFLPYLGYLLNPFEFRENRDYHRAELNMELEQAYEQFRRLSFEAVFGPNYGLQRRVKDVGFRAAAGKHAWCAKTYPNRMEAEGLLRLFPNGKFVYMHRSGYDVVNSRSRFRGMSAGSFEENCRLWAEHAAKYHYLCELEQALPVRQEDVVRKPDDVFRRVQDFIGVPYEEGPARFAKTTLIHPLDERTMTADVSDVFEKRLPVYEAWTEDERATFKAYCTEPMTKLGYEIPF
jgi:hypothetical protein